MPRRAQRKHAAVFSSLVPPPSHRIYSSILNIKICSGQRKEWGMEKEGVVFFSFSLSHFLPTLLLENFEKVEKWSLSY
jgi:hypothetical protein